MDHYKKWGLSLAKSLNFTDAQYEEAHKRVESPQNANQLLVALLDVSKSGATQHQLATDTNCSHDDKPELLNNNSSCHSSTNSFPSSASSARSLNPSLESLSQQQQQQQQPPVPHQPVGLRKIFIDGLNVARSHGRDELFSWQGIQICVHWFATRGHRVKVFVPAEKCQQANKSCMAYLRELNALVETPTGCNDDMFVIEAAKHNNGVIVSNDMFRDETRVHEELQVFVNRNRLPYVFVDDLFIPASDPRGRLGPHLDEFLSEQPSHEAGSQQSLNHRRTSYSRTNFRFQKNCLISLSHKDHPSQLRGQQRQPVHRTSSVVYPAERHHESSSRDTHSGARNNGRRVLCSTKSHFI